MEETTQPTSNSKAGKGLGIAGLVLGILAAVLSFVPCLVCSIVGCSIAGWQWYALSKLGENSKESLELLKEGLEHLDTAKLRMDMEDAVKSITDSLEAH